MNYSLIMLGLGMAGGVVSLLLLLELWPLLVLGTAGYLMYRGVTQNVQEVN